MKTIIVVAIGLVSYYNLYAQSKTEIVINNVVKPVQKVYSVKSSDEIQINIYLDDTFLKYKFINTIQAKTCNTLQDQQQEQRAKDKTDIFLEKVGNLLSKKRAFGYSVLNSSDTKTTVKIFFHPYEISTCPNRYFWIYLLTNPVYKERLNTIENLKEKYQFMLLE